jgi:hypothetical protein
MNLFKLIKNLILEKEYINVKDVEDTYVLLAENKKLLF